MNRRRLLMNGGFPKEPSEYELLQKYTAAGTFTAPETGWFQIEVFGASGNGGKGDGYGLPNSIVYLGGGGGGGGGYACSQVKLKKGNTIEFVCGAVGAESYAVINSSKEKYERISVTSGKNGNNATHYNGDEPGTGGGGGVASGGNVLNSNGYRGGTGGRGAEPDDITIPSYGDASGGAGGKAGYTGGNAGGKGAHGASQNNYGSGKAGFIKLYRGNTN